VDRWGFRKPHFRAACKYLKSRERKRAGLRFRQHMISELRRSAEMASAVQIENARPQTNAAPQAFFSIPELAERWRCSRASVYNRIRGEKVVDFAAIGRKGHKLIPPEVVLKIERTHLRVLR
jgi:hypothetical protein